MHSLCRQSTLLAENSCDHIIHLFEKCFLQSFNTRLLKGGAEPEYIPAANNQSFHQIIFTKDYTASALHEVAHWCVAGDARRLLRDYGYWYEPDGRDAEQQLVFESVEVKPQALEWLFARACNLPFRVSADNLDAQMGVSDAFKCAIVEQVKTYCRHGVNDRASKFIHALSDFYGTETVFDESYYSVSHL